MESAGKRSIEWTIPYKPYQPHQQTFLQNAVDRRISAFFAGLQSGKSVAGAIALFTLLYILKLKLPKQSAHLNPEVWILSKSYTLVDTAFEYFRAVAGPMLYTNEECRKMGLQRGDSRTFWLHPNEPGGKPIRLRCRTAADPESLRATPVLLAAWCDEVAFWREAAWLNLQGRGIVTPTRYLITTTPKGKNWLYQDVYIPGMNGTENIGVVTCRSADNPYADKAYLEKLRKKFGEGYAAQELDGLFTQATGYVYNFDRVLHGFKTLPSQNVEDYKVRVIGVDPGYGDPYAACLLLKDWDNRWWQLDEMYLPGKAIVDDAYPTLKGWVDRWKVSAVYCDKRRPADWVKLKRMGLPAKPNPEIYAEDDRRTIMPGIRVVQRLFRENRFKVHESCEWTMEEAENYAFPDREERNQGENPIDWKNHCVTGDTWVDCVDGRVQIRDLVGRRDVYVWAFDGEIPRACLAKDIRKTRESAEVVKVTFDNTSLLLTSDHLVMRKDGSWIEAGKLKANDRVRALYKSYIETGYIQIRTGRGKSRYEAAHRLVWESLNGPIPSGHVVHHKDENTLNNHPLNLELMTREAHVAHHQPFWVEKARYAKRNPRRTAPRNSICAYCGSSFVNSGSPSNDRKTCSRKCWTGLRINNHRVLSVEPYGMADVYNMEVDGLSNFVANGVCVHNCMDAWRYGIIGHEELTDDRRQRRRGGMDGKPHPVGGRRLRPGEAKWKAPTVGEWLAWQDKKFDQQNGGRRG